jgi:hypothetical protein
VFKFPGYKRDANQATLMFHLTPVRMAIIKGKDVEKQELLNTAGGNEN